MCYLCLSDSQGWGGEGRWSREQYGPMPPLQSYLLQFCQIKIKEKLEVSWHFDFKKK